MKSDMNASEKMMYCCDNLCGKYVTIYENVLSDGQ